MFQISAVPCLTCASHTERSASFPLTDHMPFVRAGVPAIDVIDVDYAPWHTDADTMDKISAQSLEIVGTVIYESVLRLEHQ